ncbi:hypothetical protein PR202_ga13899 [Eleusine coracana subsp. coracana]|uniref:BZIP domain-containing protein n=1 Tax=Eleusine coracana subsp. coracana TaxID=191504 RepID=A0AAV5CFW1_ELECO|nr:hypothetical protein PR202_ga13899 [Eleusine coracana subsp. coracana]
MASSTSTSGDERPAGVPRDPSSVAVPGPQTHAEWVASMQAYYAAAQQHMVAAAAAAGAPYGAPMPFPMYHPAYYAHASIAAGVPYPAGEAAMVLEGSSKINNSRAPSGDASSRSSDGGSEESSDKRENAQADLEVLPSAKRRKPSNTNVKGESSQAGAMQDAAAGLPFAAKRRSASKLSVHTPERAAVSDVAPNLNIGMDIWGRAPAKAETAEQGEVNVGALTQHAGALSQMDERELKKERRKQSNRESARRSRLRKQGEMEQKEGPGGVSTTLSIQTDASKNNPGNNGLLQKNNDDSKG